MGRKGCCEPSHADKCATERRSPGLWSARRAEAAAQCQQPPHPTVGAETPPSSCREAPLEAREAPLEASLLVQMMSAPTAAAAARNAIPESLAATAAPPRRVARLPAWLRAHAGCNSSVAMPAAARGVCCSCGALCQGTSVSQRVSLDAAQYVAYSRIKLILRRLARLASASGGTARRSSFDSRAMVAAGGQDGEASARLSSMSGH